ncbi:MAG: hypothetical protein AABW56_03750, partial [Nanoarchaeota archaeon]
KDTKSWGGFFGKDTSVVYTEDEFKSAKGSKILVDLEKGQIKAEFARIEEGLAVDAKNVISKLQEGIKEIQKKVEQKIDKISDAHDILKKAQEDFTKSDKEYEKSLKENGHFSPETIGKDLKRTVASYKFIKTKEGIREGIAKDIGLNPNSPLLKQFPTTSELSSGLSTTKAILKYASKFLGAAGDLSNNILGGIDSATAEINNPFLKSLNPSPDSRMNIQLSNPIARSLKNIEMYGGSLEIADSYGNLAPIVKTATTYAYVLPSQLNNKNNYFDGINFNLNNENFENKNGEKGQTIQIFSDNGMLNAIGTGLKDLKTVEGELKFEGGGSVDYTALFGLIRGSKGSYETILKADYKSSPDARKSAIEFFNQANNNYKKLYDKYQTDGWTKLEKTELTKLYNDNFVEYNRILNSGDIELSVSSSRLNQILDSFSASGNSLNNPIINQIELDTFNNDPILQKQLAERGISPSNIKPFVDQEIANINNFIKSNTGTNLQFVKDSSNGIYQIKTDGAVYNIDPSVGPFISSTLPVIISHGGIDSYGNFYLDTRNSRFGKNIGINVYGGYYKGFKEIRRAEADAPFIISEGVKKIFEQKIIDPKSR